MRYGPHLTAEKYKADGCIFQKNQTSSSNVYAQNRQSACLTVTVNFLLLPPYVDARVHLRGALGRSSSVNRSCFTDPSASAVIPVVIAHVSHPPADVSAVGSETTFAASLFHHFTAEMDLSESLLDLLMVGKRRFDSSDQTSCNHLCLKCPNSFIIEEWCSASSSLVPVVFIISPSTGMTFLKFFYCKNTFYLSQCVRYKFVLPCLCDIKPESIS